MGRSRFVEREFDEQRFPGFVRAAPPAILRATPPASRARWGLNFMNFRDCARIGSLPLPRLAPSPARVARALPVPTLPTSAPRAARLPPVAAARGFGFGPAKFALLVEVGFVAAAHAGDRRDHPGDQGGEVPRGLARPGPGDGAEKEHADDRNEVAEALPVEARGGGRGDSLVSHDLPEHPSLAVGFQGQSTRSEAYGRNPITRRDCAA